jgi:hypothetical protein
MEPNLNAEIQTLPNLRLCPDCGVAPGKIHERMCGVERCSACGGQYTACHCPQHDHAFSRWTGLYPGTAEASALSLTNLSQFYNKGYNKIFFIKPSEIV